MLTITNLTKKYISKRKLKVMALSDITLDLPSSGLIFIVGKSGSGKSTLLNIIGGMENFDSGSIFLNGVNIRSRNKYRNYDIGFVFQEYNLVDNLTAIENVELALLLQGRSEDVKPLFARFGLDEQKDKYANEMSGGQQQRVAIIRALVKRPKIILCDEPTGALDNQTAIDIMQMLKQISTNTLVIVASHALDLANKYADRIIELKDGIIVNDSLASITSNKMDEVNNKKYLSVWVAFKLGLKGLYNKKFRLIFAILLSIFALSTVGVFASFANYNRQKVFINSMYDAGNYYMPLSESVPLDDEDYIHLQGSLPHHDIIKNYQVSRLALPFTSIENYLRTTNSGIYENVGFNNTLELDSSLANKLKIKLIAGNFPVNDNEVMVSKYIFSSFKELGYQDYYTKQSAIISNYSDLIGKKIGSDDVYNHFGGFIITGIVDTSFDEKTFELIEKKQANGSVIALNAGPYVTSLHKTLFNKSGFSARFNDKYNMLNTKFYEGSNFRGPAVTFQGNRGIIYSLSKLGALPYIKKSPLYEDINADFHDRIVWKNNINKNELQDNEVVIDFSILNQLYRIEDRVLVFYCEEKTLQIIEEFAKANINLVKNELSTIYQNPTYEDYIDYIINCGDNNLFQNGKTYEFFVNEVRIGIVNQWFNEIEGEIIFSTEYSVNPYNKKVEIVGVYLSGYNANYNFLPTTFISDSIYNDFLTLYPNFNNYSIFTILTGDYTKDYYLMGKLQLSNLIETMERELFELSFTSFLMDSIINSEANLKKISKIFMYLSCCLAIFAAVMMYNYFSASIIDDSKKIGILKAMGASNLNIFTIYYLRSIIFIFICTLLSIGGALVLVSIVNRVLYYEFYLFFTILSFDLLQGIMLFFFCFFVITISSLIPIINIIRKTPMKLMKN